MWSVERIDVAASGPRPRPARRLNRPGYFHGQFVEVSLPCLLFYPAFVHQAQQIAIGADVVEAMIVHADMRNMGGHVSHRMLPTFLKEALVARGIELKNLGAELKTLRPFGPATTCIPPLDG